MTAEPFCITAADVEAARERIRDGIYYSPLARSETLSQRLGCHLYLKLENLQMSGSFKERGALNTLLQLSPEQMQRGVILASAGNHAQGVAYHGTRLGAPVTVVMPEHAALNKVRACRGFGAEVVLHGATFEESLAEAQRRRDAEGLTFVHPFADPPVMAGQGTIGLEILEQCPDVEVVIAPIGGGGLVAGVSTVMKAHKPDVRIIGVEADAMAATRAALDVGHPVEIPVGATIADGIAVRRAGDTTFPILQALVDDVVTVHEDEIAAAILTLLEDEKTVAEGAGAVPLAAATHRELSLDGRHVVLIVTGGNIDIGLISTIIELGEVKSGRLLQLRLQLQDRPGELARLATIFGEVRANVVQIHHSRSVEGLRIGEAVVDVQLETRDFDHIAELKAALGAAGYPLHD